MKKNKCLIAAIASVCFATTFAQAVLYTWTGSVDNDWNNTANWAGGTVPTIHSTYGLISNTITIQNNGNNPTVNVPGMAAYTTTNTSPRFIVEAGASFSLAKKAGVGNYGGLTGSGTMATVGNGASLTYVLTDQNNSLSRNTEGVQSYFVNGGTLTFDSTGRLFTLADSATRRSSITVDGGTLNILAVGGYLRGHPAVLASGTGFENEIILKNGGDCSLNTTMDNMLATDGTAMAFFDLQSTNSVVQFMKGRAFNSVNQVTNQFGNVFRSSTLGTANLVFTDLGSNVYQVSVIPEPATIGMLGLGALVTLLIRRLRA